MRLTDGREIFLVQRDYLVMWPVGGLPLHAKNMLSIWRSFCQTRYKRTGKLAVNIHFESNFSTYHRIKVETETGACHEQPGGGAADAEVKVAPDEISRRCVFLVYS